MYALRYLYRDGYWFTLAARVFYNETEAGEFVEEFIKSNAVKEWFLKPLYEKSEC